MQLQIKNMVCDRCIKVVKEVFEKHKISNFIIKLGVVDVQEEIPEETFEALESTLKAEGFEIITDQARKLVEQIKNIAIELVYKHKYPANVKFSVLLSEKIGKDYNYLSTLFSSVEDKTIEHYLIELKIERVKELLVYGELTLSEIADLLGYSSTAHLSGQFKKVTGFTPSHYKQLGDKRRRHLNEM